MEALVKIHDEVERTEPFLVVYLLDQTLSNFTSAEDEQRKEFAKVSTYLHMSMYINLIEHVTILLIQIIC